MPGGLQSGFESPEQHPQDRSQPNGDEAEANQRPFLSANEWTNSVRSQEIMGKQVSGILILLLKWFKLSRKSNKKCWPLFRPDCGGRYPEIRIPHTATPRLQLRSADPEALHTSRTRARRQQQSRNEECKVCPTHTSQSLPLIPLASSPSAATTPPHPAKTPVQRPKKPSHPPSPPPTPRPNNHPTNNKNQPPPFP